MSNLPDDVTHGDIDAHYGGEEVIIHADVSLSVKATALESDSDDRKEEKLLEAIKNGEWQDVSEIYIWEEERL